MRALSLPFVLALRIRDHEERAGGREGREGKSTFRRPFLRTALVDRGAEDIRQVLRQADLRSDKKY